MDVKEATTAAEAQRQDLAGKLAAAQLAEEDARTALENAQYQAITAGKAIPGAVADGVQEAVKRRAEIEGALAGFERNSSAALQDVRRKQRAAREARVEAAAAAMTKAVRDFKADIDTLLAKGGGAGFAAAVRSLRYAIGTAGPNTLTPAGWQINEEIFELRKTHPEELMTEIALRLLGAGAPEALERIDKIASSVVAGVRSQPETWVG